MYIYIYLYIRMSIYVYLSIYIYIRISICLYIYRHVSIYVNKYVYIYIHMCVYIYMCIFIYVYYTKKAVNPLQSSTNCPQLPQQSHVQLFGLGWDGRSREPMVNTFLEDHEVGKYYDDRTFTSELWNS